MRCLLLLALLLPTMASAVLNATGYAINPVCFNSNGSIDVSVSGGTPPYTYVWSDGPTTEDRTGLGPGSYQVTVTDNVGATDVVTKTLVGGIMVLPGITYAGGFPCAGNANGSFAVLNSITPGVAPYTTTVTDNFGTTIPQAGVNMYGDPLYTGVSYAQFISILVTDANGCMGGYDFMVDGPQGIIAAQLDNTPACGSDGGSITIAPSSMDWPVDLTIYDPNAQVMGQTYQTTTPLTLTDLAPGGYTVIQGYTFGFATPCPSQVSYFTIGDLGPNCGTVSGTSWYDVDADCVQDAGELPIPFSTLVIQPGNQNVLTNGSGHYSFPIVNGNYTLAQSDPTLVSICPGTMPTPFTKNTNAQSIPLANGSTEPLDLALYMGQSVPRPGFNYEIWGTARNLSPQLSGAVTVTMTFDPGLVYQYASPAPVSVVGNVVTWSFPALGSFQYTDFFVMLNVPVGTALGTLLTSAMNVSNTLADVDPGNDSATLTATVVGSYDPNDKTVRTSTGWSDTQYVIGDDEWLDYTIRFQNTGTDTAFTVVVTDVIDADLDMSTFEQGTASHSFDVSFRPGRLVEWRFDNIMLADSNMNEALSHGLVNFRIKPRQPLLPGTIMTNAADIFFDFNMPIHTNDAVVVAETSTQVQGQEQGRGLSVFPNPAGDQVQVIWTGADALRSIEILALDGRTIRYVPVTRATFEMDLQQVPAGIYMLRCTTITGLSIVHRLAKH